jgi:CheY-like chemotaxis protein
MYGELHRLAARQLRQTGGPATLGATTLRATKGGQSFPVAGRRPDAIVADVGMPDEDGYSLLTRLRRFEAERGTARVPAVAVTAFARNEDRQRALDAGFDDHMPKPVDVENLVTLLRQLLESARTRR